MAPPASAAGSGSFSPAPSLGTPRTGPSAVLLAEGRVLVAGGYYNVSPALGNAEVFVNGGFSSAGIGSLATPRQQAAAARLGDGRVLLAGGFNDISYLSSTEIFNPTTNSFGPALSMPGPRGAAVAAPLPDGSVLIAGGNTDGAPSHVLASAFVYHAATNSYTLTGAMTTPREHAVAAPLPDGRVLVAGGFDGSSYLSSAEIFDPVTGSFSSAGVGSMTVPREGAAAAPLPDGRVLIAGGYSPALLA
ncbi:MAG: kelch repeat-containing protein, partial [Solirubrobacterales bacterium]